MTRKELYKKTQGTTPKTPKFGNYALYSKIPMVEGEMTLNLENILKSMIIKVQYMKICRTKPKTML